MSPFSGACEFCRCTEANPCTLPDGETCAWFNRMRTVCTNPACIRAYHARQQRAHAETARRDRKRTPAEIHRLMLDERKARRREQRARAKKKGRAA